MEIDASSSLSVESPNYESIDNGEFIKSSRLIGKS